MAEGIKVGDGVLKFLADTTDLEQGYQKVDEAPQHLGKASASVDQLGAKFEQTGVKATAAGEEMAQAAEKTEFSMDKARGTVALLGEETGVRLPRHLRTFVAELPGVGAAMSAAFEATAVLILIDIIVKVTEKIVDFISSTFILTDSMKENMEAIKKSNAAIVEQRQKLEELRSEYLLIGKEGSERLRIQLGLLNATLDEQKSKLEGLRKAAIELSLTEQQQVLQHIATEGILRRLYDKTVEYLGGESKARKEVREEIVAAQNAYLELRATIQTSEQQEKNMHKELTVQVGKETEALRQKYNEATKQLNTLMTEQQGLLSQMEKISNVHPFDAQVEVVPAIIRDLDNLNKAYTTLGMKSILQLDSAYQTEKKAVIEVDNAYVKHLATLHDVHMAHLKLIQDKIVLEKALGHDTTALEKEEKQLKKQIPEMQQYGKTSQAVAQMAGQAITQAAFAFGQGSITITQALQQITAAIIRSVAQLAEKKGVEQLAWAFGSWPDFAAMSHHFAAAGLWFGLAGGLSAAAGATGGSSAGAGTPANPVSTAPVDNSPATQKQQAPVVVTGVQHFATGGLITKPTLAMMAEKPGQKELALPLDDPQAHEQIRKALGGGDSGIHVNVKGLVSPDNLSKVVKKINRMVKSRKVTLTASSARRSARVGGQ